MVFNAFKEKKHILIFISIYPETATFCNIIWMNKVGITK